MISIIHQMPPISQFSLLSFIMNMDHNHQTSHFFTGFILDPRGHWKSSANSRLLEKGPWTLFKQRVFILVFMVFSNKIKWPEHPRGVNPSLDSLLQCLIPVLWAPGVGCRDPKHLNKPIFEFFSLFCHFILLGNLYEAFVII